MQCNIHLSLFRHLIEIIRYFGDGMKSPTVTAGNGRRPPEAPYYVYPENSGFETQKMAISLSGDSGFQVQKG
jgi:hypothetical protein